MECGWRGSRRAPSNVVAGPDSVNVLATDVAPHNGRIKVRDQYANGKRIIITVVLPCYSVV